MLMIRPEPRSIMCSRTAFVIANAPNRLTLRTLCQSSAVILRTVLSTVIPALFTRKSIRPNRSSTSATTRAQSSVESTRPWCTETCARVVAEVLDRFGRIDFLVNNAGITVDKTVRKMTADDWHNVLNVNLFGAFAMTKAVLEHMIERGSGRIINISSVIGETGNVGQANY